MPRPKRLHMPGGFYHVMLRGNHRQRIFFGDSHLRRFEDLVADAVERCGIRVHAYCWMPNHVHLAIQVADLPLGAPMQRIASRYARFVQRKVPTTGHLFERRYRAILVDDVRYLLELVRYIHLNPVRAALVADPASYEWSGHRAYLGADSRPWMTTDHTLRLLAREAGAARQAYVKFVLAGIGTEPPPELRDGGSEDRRLLGIEPGAIEASDPGRRPALTLDELIDATCAANGVRTEDLARAGRSRRCALVRAVVAHHAVRLNLCTLTDLARRFGRSASTLSESLEFNRRAAPDAFATLPPRALDARAGTE